MSQHKLPHRHRPKMGQWSSFRIPKHHKNDHSEYEYGFASEEMIRPNQYEKDHIDYGYGYVSEELVRPISKTTSKQHKKEKKNKKNKKVKKDNIDNGYGYASAEMVRPTMKKPSKKHKKDRNDYGYEDHNDYGYGHASEELQIRPTSETTKTRRTKSLERPRRRNSIVRPLVDQLPRFDDDFEEKPKPKSMPSVRPPPKPKSLPSMLPPPKSRKPSKEQQQRPRRSLMQKSKSVRSLVGPLKRLSSFRIKKTKSQEDREEEKKEEDSYREGWDDGSIGEVNRPRALRRRSKDAHLMESPRLEKELMKRNTRRGRRSELRRRLSEKFMLSNDGSSSTHIDFSERDSTGRNSCKMAPANSQWAEHSEDNKDDCLGVSITSSVAPPHNLKDEEVMLLLYRELQTIDQ